MTLAEINAMDRATFVAKFGHVFEHSPWIAEEGWEWRPHRTKGHLKAAMTARMYAAPRERQLTLIRAHPDLAGRLAQQNQLTVESTKEQAAAGLSALSAEELAEFQRLNETYRARFGFPFIICARLNHLAAIREAMHRRLGNSAEEEFKTALDEIAKIAQLRMKDVMDA